MTIDARSLQLPQDPFQAAIDYLTWAFRALEERARGRPAPTEVSFFIGALDRELTPEERAYAAMVFAAHKESRDELTALLEGRFALTRGAAIAAVDEHLRASFSTAPDDGARPPATRHLHAVRRRVLAKAARFL